MRPRGASEAAAKTLQPSAAATLDSHSSSPPFGSRLLAGLRGRRLCGKAANSLASISFMAHLTRQQCFQLHISHASRTMVFEVFLDIRGGAESKLLLRRQGRTPKVTPPRSSLRFSK